MIIRNSVLFKSAWGNIYYYYLLSPFNNSIYNYTPETMYVSKVCNVTDILWLQFIVFVILLAI